MKSLFWKEEAMFANEEMPHLSTILKVTSLAVWLGAGWCYAKPDRLTKPCFCIHCVACNAFIVVMCGFLWFLVDFMRQIWWLFYNLYVIYVVVCNLGVVIWLNEVVLGAGYVNFILRILYSICITSQPINLSMNNPINLSISQLIHSSFNYPPLSLLCAQ